MNKLNRERTAHGEIATKAFADDVGLDLELEPETVFFDLLVCLRFVAERRGVDFGAANEDAAEFHALAKVAPDGWVSLLPTTPDNATH